MTDTCDPACVPLVLDERIPGDRAKLDELSTAGAVSVQDLYPAQLDELRAMRGIDPILLAEQPRWVYYPWRAAAARMLGPVAFRRLRLDRNRNKITEAEQRFFGDLTVGVVGASVGHLVALGLTLEGLFGTLRIADYDTVELSNLNRLPGSVLDYGLNKTIVLTRRIVELDPYLAVQPSIAGLDVASVPGFVAGLDLVIEVCDSLDVKLAIREQARDAGIPVIMVTSDRGTVDVERFDLDPGRKPFHGLVEGLTSDGLADLSAASKVPYVMNIVGAEGLSARMAASMLEIDESLSAWPHLAGDAMQAAASAVMAVRRFGFGDLPSGRLHIDIETALDRLTDPVVPRNCPPFDPVGPYRNLPDPDTDVAALVRAAQLAPSGGNCQPWTIRATSDAVRITLDETRTTAMDVEFRASWAALGAAVFNMRVAAAVRGVLGAVEPGSSGVVMRLGSGGDERLADLHKAMLSRVTNRNVGDPGARIPDPTLADLAAAARAEGGQLHMVTGAALTDVAELAADADRIRFLLPELHRDMMNEMKDPRTDALDRGIDLRTLELGPAAAMLGLVRRADVMSELARLDTAPGETGRVLGSRVRWLVESSSAVVAVTVSGTRSVDYLRGGQAMERVWIAATAAGLAVQPVVPLYLFTQGDDELRTMGGPYSEQLVASRQQLRELLNIPQGSNFVILLRLSYAPPPSAVSLRNAQTSAFVGAFEESRVDCVSMSQGGENCDH